MILPSRVRSGVSIGAISAICAAFVVSASAATDTLRARVIGGSADQRALVRQILARMGSTQISAVRIGRPRAGWGALPRSAVAIRVTSGGTDIVLSEWEAQLLAGAFRDLSKKLGLPPVIIYEGPGGGGARIGPSINGLSPPEGTAATAHVLQVRVAEAVTNTAGMSGVETVRLQILRPQGLAFALVLRTGDPAAYMKHQLRDLLDRLRTRLRKLDGFYFALQDATGEIVWKWAVTYRFGAASVSTRPDLEGCNPIPLSRPPGATIPPCPAQ